MRTLNRRTFLGTLGAASGLHHRPPPRPRRPRLHRAERHDPARPGRLRHAGAAPGQHRPRAPAGPAVRRGRRSQPRQPGLRRLGAVRQPRSDPPVPRGPDVGRRRHRHPRRPRRRAGDHGDLLPEAEPPGRRHPVLRGLPRDAREGDRHPGRRQHHARSPARQHQHRGAAERQGRDLAQAGGAACSTKCGARCRPRASSARAVAPARLQQQADRHTLAAWIKAGVDRHRARGAQLDRIGRSGRRACRSITQSGPPVPDGFNWALWQGPEPDRPYHPSYTFAVYRGWYAYGTGCLGDMGHYSLWQPYRILDLGVPEFVEARPNNDACRRRATTSATAGTCRRSAFPKASTVRWRHPATARPAGGRHVLVRRRDEAADAGGAVRGRRGPRGRGDAHHRRQGQDPVRLPRQCAAPDPEEPPAGVRGIGRRPDVGHDAAPTTSGSTRSGTARSRKGSFEQVAPLAEAVTLAAIALRVPYKRLLWDAAAMEFTNSPEATRLVRREQYRQGWEAIIG